MALDLNEAERQLGVIARNLKKAQTDVDAMNENVQVVRQFGTAFPVSKSRCKYCHKSYGKHYGPECPKEDCCHACQEPIPPQDIRCQDSEGRDVCLACGDGVKPDNDDPEVFSYA